MGRCAPNLTSQPKPGLAQTYSFPPRAARYVRSDATQLQVNGGGTSGLQLAELEVFGLSGLSRLSIQGVSNRVVLQWTHGVLQSGSSLAGDFQDVSGAQSPYTNDAALGEQYCRLRLGPATRQRHLALGLGDSGDWVAVGKVTELTPRLTKAYAEKTSKTVQRDFNALVEMGLTARDGRKVRARREVILAFLPLRRKEEKPAKPQKQTAA